jgi:deoxyribodipyrimidine photo-lyase
LGWRFFFLTLETMTALAWLRNDLRLHDNPALHAAAALQQGVIAVYVHCDAYVSRFPIAPARLDFVRRHLRLLTSELARHHIALRVLRVAQATEIAPALARLAQEQGAHHCFFNAEYPLDELTRDQQVNQLLRAQGMTVKRCHDRVIIPPGKVRNEAGAPYKVFTPYKRKWLQLAQTLPLRPLEAPAHQATLACAPASAEEIDRLFEGQTLRDLGAHWPAGEAVARERLQRFVAQDLSSYQAQRDLPAVAGTSGLSPYLAVGALSPRQALAAVLAHTGGDWNQDSGVSTWIGELIWREFYQHLVTDYPQVCMHRAMQGHTEAFPWRHDPEDYARWCEGRTGIPIIDAAMRQLNATGWMHNRLRMLVAMFLSKNLQIDWRWGERYFMEQLIDGDFAANNGGWQWSASTGTDAAPYFRIFNPITQSQRFDPQGQFIRAWVPELAGLSDKAIHAPHLTPSGPPPAYPAPMVDLGASRKATIDLFACLGKAPASEPVVTENFPAETQLSPQRPG